MINFGHIRWLILGVKPTFPRRHLELARMITEDGGPGTTRPIPGRTGWIWAEFPSSGDPGAAMPISEFQNPGLLAVGSGL